MKEFIETKNILSKEINFNFEFYDNDKFIGVLLADKSKIFSFVKFIHDHNKLNFNQLIDITAIDYPPREYRFDMIYLFLSYSLNQRILLKVPIKEDENIESVTSIHNSANWYERECYDLFGIKFINHPDLRRIMTDYNFEGHPLRKDFPLTGHNEVHYDDLEKKVVYDKVNLSQEFRNFDYLSPWEGIENELKGDDKVKKEN